MCPRHPPEPAKLRGNGLSQPALPASLPKQSYRVFIVESPAPKDIYHGRSESTGLSATLKLAGVDVVERRVVNTDMLLEALAEIHGQLASSGPVPIVHVSAHGATDCLQLCDGKRLTWDELSPVFELLNAASGGRLILAVSSCHGIHAAKMSKESVAFHHVVGPVDTIPWSDALVGFVNLYNLTVRQGVDLADAVNRLNALQGPKGKFGTLEGVAVKKAWTEVQLKAKLTKILDGFRDAGMLPKTK